MIIKCLNCDSLLGHNTNYVYNCVCDKPTKLVYHNSEVEYIISSLTNNLNVVYYFYYGYYSYHLTIFEPGSGKTLYLDKTEYANHNINYINNILKTLVIS